MPTARLPPPTVFLGGIFTLGQTEFVARNSIGVVQNAADALQKSIILGLVENGIQSFRVVNLPFIGSYPRGFALSSFPATEETIYGTVQVEGQKFSLFRFIKSFSRLSGALRGLRAATAPGSVVLVYSAHLPFMAAALVHRTFGGPKICLIIPDLPEFMGEGGWKYRAVKAVESRIFYALARLVDRFVLLTPQMAERLRIPPDRFVVVEGIANPRGVGSQPAPTGTRSFLYTGTLARRYGIMDLVTAFTAVIDDSLELWICGEGDTKSDILAAAQVDSRIKFLGQLSREQALELQLRASVLVNPRLPVGEYTRYSFPSKTMEYMTSGRPVLMYPLPGMPPEYQGHFFPLDYRSSDTLEQWIRQLASVSDDELDAMGKSARTFILGEKNAKAQAAKILAMISFMA